MGDYSNILLATPEEYSSAKRLSDNINALAVAQPLDVLTHSWIAVSLADGSYDGTLYDTRADAVKHQVHETQCAYVCLKEAISGMDIREAYAYLKFHRDAYAKGYVFTDPERPHGGVDLRLPVTQEGVRSHGHAMAMTRRYDPRKKR